MAVSFDADPTSQTSTQDDRSYATFQHVVPLIAHVGTPFVAPLIAAIIMWQIKKDQKFLDDHGREATNFQISLLVYAGIAMVLGFLTCGVAWVLYVPLLALNIIGCVLAAKAANRGGYYRYPMCLRFV
jgi:uncharacterized protein